MKKAILAIYAALLAGNTSSLLAQELPTMGWSSWNTYKTRISDDLIRRQADAMVSTGLAKVGYQYINIDDGYFYGRSDDGTLLVHPKKFPNGLKPVAEYVHSKGLKAGIYSEAGDNTCANIHGGEIDGRGVGLYGYDQQDIDFFFKDCGFDFIKVDYCGGDSLKLDEEKRYRAIYQAMLNTGRKGLRLNVCRWDFPGTWIREVCTSWRTTGDIHMNWRSVKAIIAENLYLSAFSGDGRYNDMDMLQAGRGMTEEEDKTHFGMWCMMNSPLLIGCDMEKMSEQTLRLFSNTELIALNQDPLMQQAQVVEQDRGVYLLVRDIKKRMGTVRAIAVYNSTNDERTYNVDFSRLDLEGPVSVRDLFEHKDMGQQQSNLAVSLPPHATRIYLLKANARREQTRYEAETAWLTAYQELKNPIAVGTAYFQEQEGCSGGAKVTNLGGSNTNDLQWRRVNSRKGGTYQLTIALAEAGAAADFYLQVNGAKAIKMDNSSLTATIQLYKGDNTVRLYNPKRQMPDIDYMTIFPLH